MRPGPKTQPMLRVQSPYQASESHRWLAPKSLPLNRLVSLLRTSADGQPSTRQTPAQVTCAHCQGSRDRPQRLSPFTQAVCPSEPPIVRHRGPRSTPSSPLFCLRASSVQVPAPPRGAHCARSARPWEGVRMNASRRLRHDGLTSRAPLSDGRRRTVRNPRQ